MKSTTYDKFIIFGSHRNRRSYVDDLNGNSLFIIDKEKGSFFGQSTTSYFVGSRSEKYKSFMPDSWPQLISHLNQIIESPPTRTNQNQPTNQNQLQRP